MREAPFAPKAGQGLAADWGRDLVDFVRRSRVRPARGQRVQVTSFGTVVEENAASVRSVRFSEERETKPWALRWLPYDEDDPAKGEWQVYVPVGAATLNGGDLYMAFNDEAKDADGEVIGDWYKVDSVDDGHAKITTETYEGVARVTKEWTVYALFKPWPRVKVSANSDGFATTMRKELVGAICETTYTFNDGGEETTEIEHFVSSQTLDAPVKLERDESGAFAVEYHTAEGKEIEKDAAWKPFVVNQRVMLGRVQATLEEDTDATGWERVVVRIDHPAEDFELSVVGTYEASDDDKTCVVIYEMKDDVVTKDNRAQLAQMPFYNN